MASKFNYSRTLQTVKRLINKFGVLTEFRSIVSTPNSNPSKPPVNQTVIDKYQAVFVGIDVKELDGIRIITGDKRVLVQGDIANRFDHDGSVIDPIDGSIWKVIKAEPVAPGPTCVLYKIQVRK